MNLFQIFGSYSVVVIFFMYNCVQASIIKIFFTFIYTCFRSLNLFQILVHVVGKRSVINRYDTVKFKVTFCHICFQLHCLWLHAFLCKCSKAYFNCYQRGAALWRIYGGAVIILQFGANQSFLYWCVLLLMMKYCRQYVRMLQKWIFVYTCMSDLYNRFIVLFVL